MLKTPVKVFLKVVWVCCFVFAIGHPNTTLLDSSLKDPKCWVVIVNKCHWTEKSRSHRVKILTLHWADEERVGVVTVKEGNLLESPGEGITITEMSFHARQAFCYLAAVWPFFLCLDSYTDNIIFIRVTKVLYLSVRILHWHCKS